MFILFVLLFIASVNAVNVTLLEPEDKSKLSYVINNVEFKCDVTGAEVAKLYTNISGSWSQTGATVYGNTINSNNGVASFIITNLPQGNFEWNCFADQTNWGEFNFSFSFKFPVNEPPYCNGTFPGITLQKNTGKNDVVNLNDYFADPENDKLTFVGVSGDNNVDVTIKTSGLVDLNPRLNRVATDSLYFLVNDGKNNDFQCGPMKVEIQDTGSSGNETQNQTNTAPRIDPEIPDQSKTMDVEFWILSLDEYGKDDQEVSDVLSWDVSGVDSDIVGIAINSVSDEARFEPRSVGESTVTFIVRDSEGLKDEQDITIKITEKVEEDLESEDAELIDIISKNPNDEEVQIETGDIQIFEINPSIKNDIKITWFVDNSTQNEDGTKFEFMAEEAGTYTIVVLVEKGDVSISKEWKVIVREKILTVVEIGQGELCGNELIDDSENCENCPQDVTCGENEVCQEGQCITEKPKITGFSIASLNELNFGQKIISGAVLLIVILIVVILIVRTRNIRKRKSSMKLSSFDTKLKNRGFLSKFKKSNRLQTFKVRGNNPVMPELVKKTEITSAASPPSGLEPIVGFINSGLASGDNPKTIRKALLSSGWSKKQVKQAFKSIEK